MPPAAARPEAPVQVEARQGGDASQAPPAPPPTLEDAQALTPASDAPDLRSDARESFRSGSSTELTTGLPLLKAAMVLLATAGHRGLSFEELCARARALLDEAERTIDPAADLTGARAAFRSLQEKWDELGKVPREQMGRLDGRLRALERRIRDAENEHWRREDPEVVARAAQFAEKVAALEEQAAKAEERGKAGDAKKLREQAEQWREWAKAAQSAVSDR